MMLNGKFLEKYGNYIKLNTMVKQMGWFMRNMKNMWVRLNIWQFPGENEALNFKAWFFWAPYIHYIIYNEISWERIGAYLRYNGLINGLINGIYL
jgi:hypothetical protein